MSKIKPEIMTYQEVLENIDRMLQDAEYKANKAIKDPRAKGQAKMAFDFIASMQYHLTELQ